MKLLDPDDPFFRPVWRRWVVTAAPLLWACVELVSGNAGWALAFALMGGFAGWQLLLKGPGDHSGR